MTSMPDTPVAIRPIGVVVSDFREFSQHPDYQATSTVVIREDLAEGLQGLEHFSHIYVFYYQHKRLEWQAHQGWSKEGHPVLSMPFATEPTCKGVYTTRAPVRPSGIGSCVCELVCRRGNDLIVRGLDAFDGTPVLDLKIYLPQYDSVPHAVSPLHWCAHHELLYTSRLLHWETMNVALALGLRAGAKAMRLLDVGRGEAQRAEVRGGHFFVQGVEGVTGCSPLQDTMAFQSDVSHMAEWYVSLRAGDRQAKIAMRDRLYGGADEVLGTPDDILFEQASVCPVEDAHA